MAVGDEEAGGVVIAPITSSTVLHELKELRQYRGMTMLRVRERAPQVQRLAATRDEAGRRQLAKEDHYIAGYYALRCAVEHAIRRPDLAHILRRTLNFAEEGNFLDDRRASLIAEFDCRPKLYARLEAEAYVQLAGVLVAAERSPCRDEGQLPDSLSFDIRLTLERKDDVQWLLTLLTVDKRRGVQEAISGLLLDQLPRGKTAVYGLPIDQRPLNDFEAARYLVALILLNLRADTVFDNNTIGFSAASDLLLSSLLDVQWTAILAARQASSVLEKSLLADDGLRGEYPAVQFYIQKAYTLRLMRESMIANESNQAWGSEISRTDLRRLALTAR